MYKPLNDTDTEEELKNAQGNVRKNLMVKELSNLTSRVKYKWRRFQEEFVKFDLMSSMSMLTLNDFVNRSKVRTKNIYKLVLRNKLRP